MNLTTAPAAAPQRPLLEAPPGVERDDHLGAFAEYQRETRDRCRPQSTLVRPLRCRRKCAQTLPASIEVHRRTSPQIRAARSRETRLAYAGCRAADRPHQPAEGREVAAPPYSAWQIQESMK